MTVMVSMLISIIMVILGIMIIMRISTNRVIMVTMVIKFTMTTMVIMVTRLDLPKGTPRGGSCAAEEWRHVAGLMNG